jgi:hypothetical protein
VLKAEGWLLLDPHRDESFPARLSDQIAGEVDLRRSERRSFPCGANFLKKAELGFPQLIGIGRTPSRPVTADSRRCDRDGQNSEVSLPDGRDVTGITLRERE